MAHSPQPARTARPARSDTQEELTRVFASPGFVQAERMQRFLRFIVERTLDGEEDCLKESVIGVQVFDREIGYDPKTDSIVRVEARRLRNKLHEYQREGGAHSRFWITLPKGGYVPEFVWREDAPPPEPAPVPRSRPSPKIAVLVVAPIVCAAALWLILSRDSQPAAPIQGRHFTSRPGYEVTPAFSPDGQTIAFAAGAIYLQRIGADQAVRLTHSNATEIEPVWSGDGRHIAFFRQESAGMLGIYIASADGSGERRINSIRSTPAPARMDWSRDGRFLVTVDRDETSATRLVLISADTGDKRKLMEPNDSGSQACPRFSPDGSRLAFVRTLRNTVEDVYVLSFGYDRRGMAVAGSPRRISFDNRNVYGIAWTRDGKSIIAASRRGGTLYQLWRFPASGGTPVKLTAASDGEAIQPAVSPQGGRLAYVLRFTDMNIWRSAVDGQSAPQPLIASTVYETDPQYSPDGKRIAFRSDRSGNGAIWVSDAEGQGAIRVADLKGLAIGRPCWSPDGQWLAFNAETADDAVIYLAPADGRSPPRLFPAAPGSENVLPAFSHDGRYLYFGSRRTGRWELWKQPVDGGRAEQLTTLGGFSGFESADGKSVYYSKGPGVPGIYKLPGEEKVLDSASAPRWGWFPGRKGIYFVDAASNEELPAELRYFDLETKTSRVIGKSTGKPAVGGTSITVSPDERWIAFAQVDRAGSDIILVENFH